MAEITEKQIFEAFGLGEEVQEPAEPATEEPRSEGEEAQEVAEPAEEVQDPEGAQDQNQDDPETAEEAEPDSGKQPQTPEQRRANAARRRQQEQERQQAAIDQAVQAAVKKEREAHEQAMSAFFSQAGLKNTITGEAITNMEQFEAWHKQFGDAKLQRDLKAGKLTPEALAAALDNHPVIQQAKQLLEGQAAARKAEEQAAAKAKIEAEIAEIHKLDESISSLEDLMKADYWPELYAKTKQGYSIKDAHYLLNSHRLEKARTDAAVQQALNNARGKDHMKGTNTPRGGGSVSVPASELAMFRQFNPGASDAEIQAYYNKYKKG